MEVNIKPTLNWDQWIPESKCVCQDKISEFYANCRYISKTTLRYNLCGARMGSNKTDKRKK